VYARAEFRGEQGDWKISGLGQTIPLAGSDGKPSRWEFPTFDGRVPSYVQRPFDYMGKFNLHTEDVDFNTILKHRSTRWTKSS